MLHKLREAWVRYPNWALAVITVLALVPFLSKPFNIDDPLFLWAAKQIQAHPGNPYGFNVEWGFREFPMSRVTENPPLACYYLALAAGIFGWNEIGLHIAFLLPAVAVVLGTYRLARRLCQSPGLAALMTLFTPVFLVSANTVMCDMLMLAFWVWAAVFWVEGMKGDKMTLLVVAGALISLALVTKYYGLCLVPLLAAHGLILKRRLGRWILPLVIPLVTIGVYQLLTASLYGSGLLGAAAHYANFAKEHYGFSKVSATLIGLAFTGGCVATVVLFAPLLWRPSRATLPALIVAAVLFALMPGAVLQKYSSIGGRARALVEVQLIFWAMGGLSILVLAAIDAWRRRDAASWLLALWVWGTFIFAALVNWTVNGRSILPLVPAVAILVARRLEGRKETRPKFVTIFLGSGAALALIVAFADFSFARAVRNVAEQAGAKYGQGPNKLWFQGHWGFQYYMERAGASPVDFKSSPLNFGDVVAVPSNNTNLLPPDPKKSFLLETLSAPRRVAITTMEQPAGAGFYSSVWGPLPFAFGVIPQESVSIYQLGSPSVAAPQKAE